MSVIFVEDERIAIEVELCYLERQGCGLEDDPEGEESHDRALPLKVFSNKPESPRGKARKASRGKRHGKWRPSHPTAPRLLVGSLAEWKRYREEVCFEADLRELDSSHPEREEYGSPIVHHPSYAGTWWDDCIRREAEVKPSCAQAMIEAARAVCARRELDLVAAIIGR